MDYLKGSIQVKRLAIDTYLQWKDLGSGGYS